LAGLAAARSVATEKQRRLLFSPAVTIAALFLGLAPDLDIIIWIALKPSWMSPHRGISHSLVVALGLALIFWLVLSKGVKRGGVILPLALILAALTHPLLDYFMGRGPKVLCWWPFNNTGYLSRIQLVPTAYYSRSLPGLATLLFDRRSLKGILLELMILVPLLLGQKYAAGKLSRWMPFLTFSLASLLLVYLIYN